MLLLALLAVTARAGDTPARKLINGGSIVDQATMTADFPWFASLVTLETCTPECGGAMVSDGTFLTAAHCVADDYGDGSGTTSIESYAVVVGFAGSYGRGQHDFPKPCNLAELQSFVAARAPKAKVLALSKFLKPIHYGVVAGYDIALVFVRSDHCGSIPSIKINGQCSGLDVVGNKLTVLGFGATVGETGLYSEHLRKLDFPIQSVGTSDDVCNLNVSADRALNSVACSRETPASDECYDKYGEVVANAPGCVAGVKTASGDSGGPWVASIGQEQVHVLVQSSGHVNNLDEAHSYLIRSAWFQDWIYEAIKAQDQCGGAQQEVDNIFFGYSQSEDQYCRGGRCLSCMDSTFVSTRCYEESWPDSCVAPQVTGCTTIPLPSPLARPVCSPIQSPSPSLPPTNPPAQSSPSPNSISEMTTCGQVKAAYAASGCCGNPTKEFKLPLARRMTSSSSDVDDIMKSIQSVVERARRELDDAQFAALLEKLKEIGNREVGDLSK